MIKLLIGGSPYTHWSITQKCGDAYDVRRNGWKIGG